MNPRRAFALAGFQDRCIQPLCHLSVAIGISGNQTDLSISIRGVFSYCCIFINFFVNFIIICLSNRCNRIILALCDITCHDRALGPKTFMVARFLQNWKMTVECVFFRSVWCPSLILCQPLDMVFGAGFPLVSNLRQV